ncbi:SCAN domain-containing protein 3-like [Neoarius graeffei]|uniref:SCAN domain-containing protein 3-like n=1 Tax=Neoarius graeffei TaxID=443677 RepID=UPI00298C37BC|nr:SCAN domain-containing protein 3-like [Neoarius graeffei]
MVDKKAADAIRSVPLSNDTICRRVDEMAGDIVQQVTDKLKGAGSFVLQLDESTDVNGEAQLIMFARFKDDTVNDIVEHIVFCKPLPDKTTGEDIFNLIVFFTEHELDWKCCSHVCTDGAASITGRHHGLVSRIRQVNPDIQGMHCIIHREALASKRMSPELDSVLTDAVKVINFIKSRPLNSRLFHKLCEEMGSDHHQLLLHTDVRWLSRGKALQRLFELREQVHDFLSEHGHPLAAQLEDQTWLAHLAYLTDVFGRLNELNTSLQGNDKTVLQMYDKVSAFMRKTDLWLRRCEKGDVSNFPQLNSWIADMKQNMKQNILKTVKMHLAKLTAEFESYFPDIEDMCTRLDWIRRPFMHSSMDTAPEQLHESLTDLSSDSGFRLKFSETSLTQFWCCVEKEYPELAKEALYQLQPFGPTYLCEVTFSALTHIKTKHRNRLQLERSIITAVATIQPRLQKLMSGRQVQVSH